MRAIVLLILFAVTSVAWADVIYSLDPAQGRDGKVVNLRIDETDEQCFPAAAVPVVVRNGNTVRILLEIEDFLPPGTPDGVCPAYRVTPRFHSLGTFTSGNYVVEVTVCSFPAGGPPCRVEATLELSVFGSNGQRFMVPAAGWPVLVLLAIALGLAGLRPRR